MNKPDSQASRRYDIANGLVVQIAVSIYESTRSQKYESYWIPFQIDSMDTEPVGVLKASRTREARLSHTTSRPGLFDQPEI